MHTNKALIPLALGLLWIGAIPGRGSDFVPPAGGITVNVKTFGAKGDGITDDTIAIQRALESLQPSGGILIVPSGTYLLDSFTQSPHPWFFYNLRAGSNVSIEGEPGARFLQGPHGRAPLVHGATEVRNSVLVFGSANYVTNTFQNIAYNGGYYPLNSTLANSVSATLSSPADAKHFAAGDYVAIYSTVNGDVIPSETSRVTSVDTGHGTLGLAYPLARTFANPSIANVTSLATENVQVKNLTVQGAEPLVANQVFGFTAADSQFLSDTSIGGSNCYGLNMNAIRDFQFLRNVIGSVGPAYTPIELPQRNSQNGLFVGNTFQARYVVFGEYAAHWRFTGNHFWAHSDSGVAASVALGGLDVVFEGNDVHGSGSVPLIADSIGLDSYAQYVGQIKITGNTISCQADNSTCLSLLSRDPVVSDNDLYAIGSAVGIKAEGSLQAARIQRNALNIESGLGIVLNTPGQDSSTITNNTITGSGYAGVYVASPTTANTGGHVIEGNTIEGFGHPISMDGAKHPGTIVANNLTQVNNSCAIDRTRQVSVKPSGFRFNNATQRFAQTISATNTSGLPIAGPVYFALDQLSANATLEGQNGVTGCALPAGSALALMSGSTWVPGQVLTRNLTFINPSRTGIGYKQRVLAGGLTQ